MFIVLGILLILAVAAYFISSSIFKERDDITGPSMYETIDDPVYLYIKNCLKKTAHDGLKHIGEQAGYADLEENNIHFTPDVTNSDAVLMSTFGSSSSSTGLYAIPYFWHMTSKDGCIKGCRFSLRMPFLYRHEGSPSIEEELDYYIDKNLERCINNFQDFKKLNYNIYTSKSPKVESTINKQGIIFNLYYPIEIKQEENTYIFDRYYVQHEIDIISIYELAKEVTELERDYRYLEMMAMNLIGDFSSVKGEIPPVADSTFEFGSPGRIWVKENVKKTTMNMIAKYTNALRAVNTKNYVNNIPVSLSLLGELGSILIDILLFASLL